MMLLDLDANKVPQQDMEVLLDFLTYLQEIRQDENPRPATEQEAIGFCLYASSGNPNQRGETVRVISQYVCDIAAHMQEP